MAHPTTRLLLAGLALSASSTATFAASEPLRIAFADRDTFPESITSTSDGTLFVSSAGTGNVYRAGPGESVASVWAASAQSGIKEMLGVYADEPRGVLYACSIGMNAAPPEADELSALFAFDLETGNVGAKFALPGGAASLCNDIAVSGNGTVYVSDTAGQRILSMPNGSGALTEWFADERLATVNGIALGPDGKVYVDTMMTGKLFRIDVEEDGAPGEIVELRPSMPLDRPDALRAIGNGEFLLAEGGGRISQVSIAGNAAEITPVATGAGWSGVAWARGTLWAVNPKAEYKMDPNLAGQDPNPFFIEAPGRQHGQ